MICQLHNVSRQVGEEGLDFGSAHLGWVALVVEEDEAANPGDVGLFGADGIVFEPNSVTNLIEQFPGALFHRPLVARLTCRSF